MLHCVYCVWQNASFFGGVSFGSQRRRIPHDVAFYDAFKECSSFYLMDVVVGLFVNT